MGHERRLQRMQLALLRQPFDGGDRAALAHHRERQAGVHPPPVDQDGAGAARAERAALLAAGEMEVVAHGVEQGRVRVEAGQAVLGAVDGEHDVELAARLARRVRRGRLRRACRQAGHHGSSAGERGRDDVAPRPVPLVHGLLTVAVFSAPRVAQVAPSQASTGASAASEFFS